MSKDFRVEMPAALCKQLQDFKISSFYIGRIVNTQAIVLCPIQFWDKWSQEQKKVLSHKNNLLSENLLLAKDLPVLLNKQGKIRIPKVYRIHFDRVHPQVNIIARDYYIIICSARTASSELKCLGIEQSYQGDQM
jgi:hypothetical protein